MLSDVDDAKKKAELEQDEFLSADGLLACTTLLFVVVLALAFTLLASIYQRVPSRDACARRRERSCR